MEAWEVESRQDSALLAEIEATTALACAEADKIIAELKKSGIKMPDITRCIMPYTAVNEDEISVQKYDVVEIIKTDMNNRCLVCITDIEDRLIAEGWIPSYVLESQPSSSSASAIDHF